MKIAIICLAGIILLAVVALICLRVFAETLLPSPRWYATWTPIGIVMCALIVSIITLIWSARQYRDSTRPFVWLIDFASVNVDRILIYHPEEIAMRVRNSPARIKKVDCQWYYVSDGEKKIFHSWEASNMVRFPDESSQSGYTIREFKKKCEALAPGVVLERDIRIEYTALSASTIYHYKSYSTYTHGQDPTWKVISEDAS